jgi:hypothetical protein
MLVEEHSSCLRSGDVSLRGGPGKDYARMSSDQTGEKPVRRKSKVS